MAFENGNGNMYMPVAPAGNYNGNGWGGFGGDGAWWVRPRYLKGIYNGQCYRAP